MSTPEESGENSDRQLSAYLHNSGIWCRDLSYLGGEELEGVYLVVYCINSGRTTTPGARTKQIWVTMSEGDAGPMEVEQNIYVPIHTVTIVCNGSQLQSPIPKMLFNVFNTTFTAMGLNINTVLDHMRIEACLEELMPTLQSSLGQRFTDASELDFVVYDLIDHGAKNNVAALFSVEQHLLGVVSWATTGTVATFTGHASLHPTPYRVVGTNGSPNSIFIHDPFMDAVVESIMGFVVQLSVS
ncbi:hypothetical protein IW261DRAFT_1423690 [Armillaria novae-zelandiae]|uniref:Uncharacterized protein n=1 Tax=Armillaria novae-zelandiae TaxID=153914 RepID=A0AA39NFV2_9AGAR|nr:hypothetical protein IW261DRAFT_1427286 [Armillaria novae-zelandiae]KAK0473486.1 hypothetical protein IW261DRAFT_1423690 [Armillaria novae-zelandiae]